MSRSQTQECCLWVYCSLYIHCLHASFSVILCPLEAEKAQWPQLLESPVPSANESIMISSKRMSFPPSQHPRGI